MEVLLSNIAVDKYLSPKLGKITTSLLPDSSFLLAILIVAAMAAPLLMPDKRPSFFARSLPK